MKKCEPIIFGATSCTDEVNRKSSIPSCLAVDYNLHTEDKDNIKKKKKILAYYSKAQ